MGYGVTPQTFYLHLKKCAQRFNSLYRGMYREPLKLLIKSPFQACFVTPGPKPIGRINSMD